MNQSERILADLKKGMVISMLDNIQRYGTSMRSRISELREQYNIADKVIDKSGAKAYFMPEYTKARKEIEEYLADNTPVSVSFNNVHKVFQSESDYFLFYDLELPIVVKLLKRGYTLIPF